ncbi:hypothetical protein NDU88_003365 [Pleurodeles waltl]|uniref:Uncharacterized protein n=1 Tax=Pleurodeles waltl TaxID=8319 RepID=A0AAV7M558_PLEWA|nr:hypothetical protein NDU88_003365 [Pleurodeles waltl]
MWRTKKAHTTFHLVDSSTCQDTTKRHNNSPSVDCIPPTNPSPPEDKLDLILREIHDLRTAIEHRIDTIATDLSILRDDYRKLADRVLAAEGTLADVAPQHTWNTKAILDLQWHIQKLHNHAEDVESRTWRNNIRIMGLPEGEEGINPIQFIKKWFQMAVAPQDLSTVFVVERAHRVPPCCLPSGVPWWIGY